MKLKEYRTYFLNKLLPLYDILEAESLFHIALEEIRGWKRVDLIMHPDEDISAADLVKWNAVLEQLEQQKPIQYIFGKAHFYGLVFMVNNETLIPRPETEELVDRIVKDNLDKENIKMLDIGTGSGCIAIALAKNLPDADVWAIDVSAGALEAAQGNARLNEVSISFVKENILMAESLPETFDVIVSNPPYVRYSEKKEIKPNVLDYEPHLALFVDDNDPLLFYRKIAVLAKRALTPGGKLYFEVNQYLGTETTALLEGLDFKDVTLYKDMYGNNRMIVASV